ncbi:Two-component nitrogen fixation transcriptional regulator FixJ [hydrothermal vent metagenome]|uniref:Two-component nitrogen fixation transcriptional regulator FixJ n=1 Tax=hydrothermal vent metagenome TaxID=652676 RepID=A0A3B1AI15_9ZZZZ
MKQTGTIYIVDDDPAVRDSLHWLIESLGYPVKTFETAQTFLDQYSPETEGCLILDVRLPGMSGLQLQKKLLENGSDLPVIIITGHGDIPMAVRALQIGALHFLEKPFRDQEILDHVQEALEVSQARKTTRIKKEAIQSLIETLTPREYQIMQDIVSGATNKSIGAKNDISVKTVEIHRMRVMHKMRADSLVDLVKMMLFINHDR